LIDQSVKGESFIIAKAGKPLVKVTRRDIPSAGQIRRLGFMEGQITVPDDFDSCRNANSTGLYYFIIQGDD